jgi:hypothetical protein
VLGGAQLPGNLGGSGPAHDVSAANGRLQAFMRTEGISTDSGPRLEVRDAYDAAALDQFTESLTGTTTGWDSLLLDFRTGPRTSLLIVTLARLPSRKFDNLIAGKVWLDDVQLTPLPQ